MPRERADASYIEDMYGRKGDRDSRERNDSRSFSRGRGDRKKRARREPGNCDHRDGKGDVLPLSDLSPERPDDNKGFDELSAEDIAETLLFVANRPKHVCIDDLLIMPTAQASVRDVHKEL